MMKNVLPILSTVIALSAHAQQFKVLHYTETSGFDHQTRDESIAMFQSLATTHGFQVDDDQTGDAFNTLSNLEQYDAVVFSNTSGDGILNAAQRSNFEAYINNGGSYLGIHAASDTYRHSTANGSSTGTWDFYAELVGASVQQNPNHVSGTPEYTMAHLAPHPSTANLPNPWVKNEEYYYWENGYFGTENNAVLEVEETVGPNNMVNSYDAPRPMSWHRDLASGGRMFYTALGHAASNFSSNQNFINHIRDALLWIVDMTVSSEETNSSPVLSVQRLKAERWRIEVNGKVPARVQVFNIFGQAVLHESRKTTLNLGALSSGLYIIRVEGEGQVFTEKLTVN